MNANKLKIIGAGAMMNLNEKVEVDPDASKKVAENTTPGLDKTEKSSKIVSTEGKTDGHSTP